ncbi:unnamed protein product [Sphagnum tenellum]
MCLPAWGPCSSKLFGRPRPLTRRRRRGVPQDRGDQICMENLRVWARLYRSLHMSAVYGLTSGILIHYWYNILDRVLPGSGIRIVFGKIFYDQILFSPICIGSCLVADSLAEGHAWKRMLAEVATKGYYLYIADCLVWPPAQFVNFYFLPTRYRVAFDNIVSLGVDVYTSHVKHQIHTDEALYSEGVSRKDGEPKEIHSEEKSVSQQQKGVCSKVEKGES